MSMTSQVSSPSSAIVLMLWKKSGADCRDIVSVRKVKASTV